MARYIQTSLTTDQFNQLCKSLRYNEECILKVYDEDDHCVGRLIISLPDNTKKTNDNNDLEAITPAQKNRIFRFLSMPEVKPEQKTFLRGYLGASGSGKRLTKTGARKVIYATICQLREQGIHLNRPSMPDVSILFSDEVVSGD